MPRTLKRTVDVAERPGSKLEENEKNSKGQKASKKSKLSKTLTAIDHANTNKSEKKNTKASLTKKSSDARSEAEEAPTNNLQNHDESSDSEDEAKGSRGKKRSEPSTEEIFSLNETPKMYKSNLFKLQIEEILKESRIAPQTSKTKHLEALLKKITNVIQSSDSIQPVPLKRAAQNLYTKAKTDSSDLGVQYPNPYLKAPIDTKHNIVEYAPPSKIAVVGSYPLGLSTRTRNGFNVDIAVQMPSELFQEKDYINYRYFYKRSFYLSCLLSILNNDSELLSELSFEYSELRGDQRLPIIVGYCKQTKANKNSGLLNLGFCIRIIPCISTTVFSRNKLSPTKNGVRANFLKTAFSDTKANPSKDDDEESSQNLPTPKYNSAVISDSQFFTHMNYLHELCKESSGFKDAVVLVKIWLSQRGFDKEPMRQSLKAGDVQRASSVNGFFLTLMLAWLINGNRSGDTSKVPVISTGLSSFQMFKNLMVFLSQYIYTKNDLALEFTKSQKNTLDSKKNSDSLFDISEFLKASKSVFTDPTGHLNLLSRSNTWELKRLSLEATETLKMLNSGNEEDGFFPIFMHHVDEPLLVYDYVFKVEFNNKISSINKVLYSSFDRKSHSDINWSLLDEANDLDYVKQKIVNVIESGLGNRSKLVEARSVDLALGATAHSLRSELASEKENNENITFLIGVVLNSSEMLKLVALGPHPALENDPAHPSNIESKKFESLWGPKSEIRRFRDGSIRLSTLWGTSDASSSERSVIVPKMVSFLMNRHFGLSPMPGVLGSEDLALSKFTESSDINSEFSLHLAETLSGFFTPITLYIENFLQSIEESEELAEDDILSVGHPISKPYLEFNDLQKIYVEWSKKVLKIGDKLPLNLSSVRTTSPFLRETSVSFPKQTFDRDDAFLSPVDIVIEFESSTKWPDDIMAMQKVKASFLQAFGEAYVSEFGTSHYNILSRSFGHSQIGNNFETLLSGVGPVSAGSASSASTDYCDLLASEQDLILEIIDSTYSGLAFRIFLKLDREKMYYERLLKKYASPLLDPKEVALKKSKVQAINSYITHWNRVFDWRLVHHYLISSFSKNYHPAFSQTCRLFKRWLACHNLYLESGQGYISALGVHGVPEELAERLVAYVFLNKGNDYKNYSSSPSSLISAFGRVLELLYTYNFSELPLMVDLGHEKNVESTEDEEKIDWTDAINHFDSLKKSKTFGGAYIATADDMHCSHFGHISALIYNRLRSLAKASMASIRDALQTSDPTHLSKVFVTLSSGYDFSLVLDPDFCPRSRQSIIPQLFNSEYLTISDKPISDTTGGTSTKSGSVDSKAETENQPEEDFSEYKNLELAKLQTFEKGIRSRGNQTAADNASASASTNSSSLQNNPLMKNRYSGLNLEPNPFGLEKMVSFDPVALFRRDLEMVYHRQAVFFHNNFGGNVIYGLWKPLVHNMENSKPVLKPSLNMNVIPLEGSEKNVTVNKDMMLQEMLRIGEGLVNKVKSKA